MSTLRRFLRSFAATARDAVHGGFHALQLLPAAQDLIDNLDRDLTYAIEVEGKRQLADVSNYDEVHTLLRLHV